MEQKVFSLICQATNGKGENAQTAKNTLTAVEPVPWVSSDAADKVHVIGKQTHNNVY